MRRYALVSCTVAWIGVANVLPQGQVGIQVPIREPGEVIRQQIIRRPAIPIPQGEVESNSLERDRAVRFHIVRLVAEQFDLNESQVAKLKTAWDSEPVPLVKEDFQSRRSMNRTPVRVLDDLLISREGVLALNEVLNRQQLTTFFESVQARKDRGAQAIAHRMAVLVNEILCLKPEQREAVGEALLSLNRITPGTEFGRLLTEPIRLFGYWPTSQVPNLEPLLSERQNEIWNLVNANHSRRQTVLAVILSAQRAQEREEHLANFAAQRGRAEAEGNQREAEVRIRQGADQEEMLDRLARARQASIEASNRQLEEIQDKLEEIALAVLETHIADLSDLDEAVSRRLNLAARGTVRQIREELKAEAVAKSERQPPAQNELAPARGRARLPDLNSAVIQGYALTFWHRILVGMQDYPLFRTTIEKALSPEEFADYQTSQSERKTFRLTSDRRAALEAMDLRLLLNQEQRRHVESWLERSDPKLSVPDLVIELARSLDQELLTEWQQTELSLLTTGRWAR